MMMLRRALPWTVGSAGLVGMSLVVTLLLTAAAKPAGSFVRTVALGQFPRAIAVDAATNRVFVTGNSAAPSIVTTLDAGSGAVLRSAPTGTGPWALTVAPRLGRAFVGSLVDRSVSILDTRSGRILRTVPIDGSPDAIAVDGRTGRAFISTSDAGGRLDVVDVRRGVVLQRRAIPGGQHAIAANERLGRVFVANSNGTVLTFDGRTGALVHAARVGRYAALVVVDDVQGRAFVSTARGVAVLGADGAVVRTIALGATPLALVVDRATGHVFAVTWTRRVDILDADRGQVAQTVLVGRDPVAMAVDERAHRLFVANQGDPSVSVIDVRAGHPARLMRSVPMDTVPIGIVADSVTGDAYITAFGAVPGRKAARGAPPWLQMLRRVPWLAQRSLPPDPLAGSVSVFAPAG